MKETEKKNSTDPGTPNVEDSNVEIKEKKKELGIGAVIPKEVSTETNNKGKSNVWRKILAVMEEVGFVKKNGKVSFKNTNYNYQKEEDITLALREARLKHGLVIVPTKVHFIENKDNITRVVISYLIVDADSGDSVCVEMGGEGQDSGDKAIYKAFTGAYKYMQRQTFSLTSQDSDPDNIPSGAFKNVNEKSNSKKSEQPVNLVTGDLDTVLAIGKHKGKTISQVAKDDPNYIKWLAGKQGDLQALAQKAVNDFKL